jgi:hypothetical protein
MIAGGKKKKKKKKKRQDGYESINLIIYVDPVNADYIPPEVISLPDPELNNLIEITETLNAARTLQEKDKISAFISNEV